MKILIAAPYLYNSKWSEFCRNKTGFGIMLNNICEHLDGKVDLRFVSYVFTTGRANWIVNRSLFRVMINSALKDWIEGFKWFFKYKQSLKMRIRFFYYCLSKGFLRKTIEHEKPDIVHIHGITHASQAFIDVCQDLDINYVVTLHGLIGLDQSIDVPLFERECEKQFLIKACDNKVPVSVISTGMKERIEKNYTDNTSDNITVVCNGCSTVRKDDVNNIDTDYKYQIIKKKKKQGAKICSYIGNITDNKNQFEAIQVVEKLDNTVLVLFGRECDGGKCSRYIAEKGLADKVIMMGFVDELSTYINEIDINLFLSKNDGFGLSIIECMVYGVPSLMYGDLDSAKDLVDEESVVTIPRDGIEKTAHELKKCFDKKWDKDEIIKKAEKFSLTRMADNYCELYKKIMRNNNM